MSKDNETIHLPLVGPVTPSETPGFTADQMIRCEACLRANPPTRFNCLYCEAPLPLSETSAHLRKPILKQPEKHEPGLNCILLPDRNEAVSEKSVEEAAKLLKLNPDALQNILAVRRPLPLARTANRNEAELVAERLRSLRFETLILSDEELGLPDEYILRPRSFQFDDSRLLMHLPAGKVATQVSWSDLCLVVAGRLVTTELEVTERMTRKSENQIVDASEFSRDEAVFDLYTSSQKQTWRIGSGTFDFSCLQDQKTLVAGENLKRLYDLVISKTGDIQVVDSYNEMKSVLEPVWPREKQTESRGWRRDGPGKYTLGAATRNSNESQFTRYSRLCYYFIVHPLS